MPLRFIARLCFVSAFCAVLHCSEVSFAQAPAVISDKAGAHVKFTLSAPSDVEVSVIADDGNVIRHIAAGVLGAANPPPAPLRAGLEQSLLWDGKDDAGAKYLKPCSFRVRAGMGVKFGRTLCDSPYCVNVVRGIASDSDGNLYVMHQAINIGPETVEVFSDTGEYVRTAFPAAANIPHERLGDLIYWDDERKRAAPRNYNDVYPRFVPANFKADEWTALFPIVTKESGILFHSMRWIFRLDVDGSTGGRTFRHGMLFPNGLSTFDAATKDVFVAIAPDGKTIYGCGPVAQTNADGSPMNASYPGGRIFRMAFDERASLRTWHDLALPKDWQTKDATPLAGMACDQAGNLYVCDRAEDCVLLLDGDGKITRKLAVGNPLRVALAKNGDVYVLSKKTLARAQYQYQLALFSHDGGEQAGPSARLDLGVQPNAMGYLAVTEKDGRTGIWVAGLLGVGNGRGRVTRYELKDGTFVETAKIHERDPEALGAFDTISVDRFTDEVYINDDYAGMSRFDGLSGKGGDLQEVRNGFHATEVTISTKGELYARTGPGYSGPLEKLDRKLDRKTQFTEYIYERQGHGFCDRGVGVGPNGEAYVLALYDWAFYGLFGYNADGSRIDGNFLKGKLKAYGAGEGNRPTSAIIGPLPGTSGGLRVDAQGNFYIGMLMLPPDYPAPPAMADDLSWNAMVGSIVKFSAQGGEWVCTNPRLAAVPGVRTDLPAGAKGVQMENGHFMIGGMAVYPEFAPFSGASGNQESAKSCLGREGCACRTPRFDLDEFDRLYVPNAVQCRVRVLDNAGNLILEFGEYGNYDSAGPDSKVPKPEIPLLWPIGVGASRERIYIADMANRRIVRADKTWALEAKCEARGKQ